jgi:hypothetical protein
MTGGQYMAELVNARFSGPIIDNNYNLVATNFFRTHWVGTETIVVYGNWFQQKILTHYYSPSIEDLCIIVSMVEKNIYDSFRFLVQFFIHPSTYKVFKFH